MSDVGNAHLIWIGRFQWLLLPLGALAWCLRSGQAALVFAMGAVCSLAFWRLHCWSILRLLNPSVPMRWLYGMLVLAKLGLILLLLRFATARFPEEGIALATGTLLFVAAILLEAMRLVAGSCRNQAGLKD